MYPFEKGDRYLKQKPTPLNIITTLDAKNPGAKGAIFEAIVTQACRMIPARGDTVVDIGANRGMHTKTLAERVGPKGLVHAFEPLKPMQRALKKRLKHTHLSNVKIHSIALANRQGKARFQYFADEPAFSGLNPAVVPKSATPERTMTLTVKVHRLDHVMRKTKKVSLIKVDVEGGEFDVLRGGEALIARPRPVILFENGLKSHAQKGGYSKGEFFGFFDALDMQLFGITGYPVTEEIWERTPPCWMYIALPSERANEIMRFKRWAWSMITEYRIAGYQHVISL